MYLTEQVGDTPGQVSQVIFKHCGDRQRDSSLRPVFQIRIRMGSVSDGLLDPDPDPYSGNTDPHPDYFKTVKNLSLQKKISN